jgi:multidrug efflux system membrane fusion protein
MSSQKPEPDPRVRAPGEGEAAVETESGPSADRPRGRGRWIIAGVLLLIVAAVVVSRSGRPVEGGKAAGQGKTPPPVPVVVDDAKSGDFPVYLTGLGTVTPLSTVTVRPRVDGQLLSVAFREGQLVKEGDLLAQIDPRPFEVQLIQAQGQLAKDEAVLKNASLDEERFRNLVSQGLVPQQQLDAQTAAVSQARAAVESDRGAIEGAKLNLTYARVTAPVSGRTGLRLVDAGNIVHASDAGGIVVLTQLDPVAVLFTLPEDSLQSVLAKLRAGPALPVEAWDRDLKNRLETGKLLTVDNQIDPQTGTVRLKAVFENHQGVLFPNQFVNVRLLLETLRGVVIVPAAAIQRTTTGAMVYVVDAGAVAMRPVEIGPSSGRAAVVTRGLAAGDVVVVDGVDKLQNGSKVVARKAGERSASPRPS